MNLDHVRRVLNRFEREGYDPIVVGGIAVLIAGYGATKDIDLIVASPKFDAIEYDFREDIEMEIISVTGGWVANGRFYPQKDRPGGAYVTFDVLNPDRFVGKSFSGKSFFEYVRAEASTRTTNGRIAKPPVVYYTRLLVPGPHGEQYLLRIIRDLDEGAPTKWLDEARDIAIRFGTEEKVQERLRQIEAILNSADPHSTSAPSSKTVHRGHRKVVQSK
jgi:hypothetical protein